MSTINVNKSNKHNKDDDNEEDNGDDDDDDDLSMEDMQKSVREHFMLQ